MSVNEYAVGFLDGEREKTLTRDVEFRRQQLDRWAEEGGVPVSVPTLIRRSISFWVRTLRDRPALPGQRGTRGMTSDRPCESGAVIGAANTPLMVP
jgi:hypothetical protein